MPNVRVARFRPSPPEDDPLYTAVPDDGLCLNAFVLLTDRPGGTRVLMGQIDPTARWEEFGGMSRARVDGMGDRWMLPSRQLFMFESPDDAAREIVRTQLGLDGIDLRGPSVTSEAWQRPVPAGTGLHWDLSFLYRGVWPSGRPLKALSWRHLALQDPAALPPTSVGRGHLDVLKLAGF